ncbi:type II toxin-antitoxin system RelE/ParE family toxin [Duganella hordei]|uniref:type II toxin-antitoxin system RelE/ParE family toxin n=1 Tax=Duganella hordei TaxID=2865934 RepID=UPI00333E836A
MHAVNWKARALADLAAILRKISSGSSLGAERLMRQVEARTALLLFHPQLGREGRQPGTRELVIHRHYVMVYRIDGDRISILRILHTARQWPPKIGFRR